MSEVYRKARRVLIWLDTIGSAHGILAAEMITKIVEHICRHNDRDAVTMVEDFNFMGLLYYGSDSAASFLSSVTKDELIALLEFYSQSWLVQNSLRGQDS
jgi:hypothetical protein